MKKLVFLFAACLSSLSMLAQTTDMSSLIDYESWSDYSPTVYNDDNLAWTCTNRVDIWSPKLYKEQSTSITVVANPTVASTLRVSFYNGDGIDQNTQNKILVDIYVDDVLNRTITSPVLRLLQPTYFFDLAAGSHTLKFVAHQTRTDNDWNQVCIRVYGMVKTDHVVVAEVTEPGSLGQEILYDETINTLADVRSLKVTGTLNDADWTTLKNMSTTLWKVDLTGVTNLSLIHI